MAAEFGRLAADDSPEALATLRQALSVRDSGTYEKHIVPYLACRALVAKGTIGIKTLAELLPTAPGYIYPMAILSTLWRAGEGEFAASAFGIESTVVELNKPIPLEIQQLASETFASFLTQCRTDPEALHRLISLLHTTHLETAIKRTSHQKFHEAVFRLLADTALRISDNLIRQFDALLGSDSLEEEFQKFLTSNPVFLHPLANRLLSKQRLGDDFITDYVLELLTGNYLVVELEKPSDPIFTSTDDFTSKFTHAFGQVIDFIDWIELNISYAQTKLPGISSPRGLLVIGRRWGLTDRQCQKLRRFNRNSSAIEVLTYDDLLSQARSLLGNIQARAVISAG